MANLTTDKNLDKHLKPIKSGEENTSLELATEGNGAKVNGDFEVSGRYSNIFLKNDANIRNTSNIEIISEEGISLDCDGSINLDSGTFTPMK